MQNGNAQHTIVFYDVHRFGRHQSKNIVVTLCKCEGEIGEFFLLTSRSFDYEAQDFVRDTVVDRIFRNQMEAMINAINLWNQVVMENPVTDEAPEPEPR